MTIVVATCFFFARDITPNEFIISRIYDTLIGVFIGLLGEMIIFPSSILPQIAKQLMSYFQVYQK